MKYADAIMILTELRNGLLNDPDFSEKREVRKCFVEYLRIIGELNVDGYVDDSAVGDIFLQYGDYDGIYR